MDSQTGCREPPEIILGRPLAAVGAALSSESAHPIMRRCAPPISRCGFDRSFAVEVSAANCAPKRAVIRALSEFFVAPKTLSLSAARFSPSRQASAAVGTFPAFTHCIGVQGHLQVNVERVNVFDEDVGFGGLDRVLDPGPGERVGFGACDNGLFADFAHLADLHGGVPDAAPGSRINRRNRPVS
ncbi:MAG TPA: hypothetical protein VEH75_03270 [Xanthobacteraceae bacterium]|nr:hypothetical protein [Xanthobacteraceae bacterium]